MAETAARPWTLEEFVAWEAGQAERYEYVDGTITLMVGGTVGHNRFIANLAHLLASGLEGSRCDVFSQGMQLRAQAAVLHPDVLVSCGAAADEDQALEDAVLVAEVASPSTARRDRDDKWRAYQALPSLQHYLLISQDQVLVEMFTRRDGSWQPLTATGLDAVLPLSALGLTLPLKAIYRGTSLAA